MQWLPHLCKHSIVSLALVLASLSWGEELRAGGLELSWNDNSDNEDGFRIERTIAGLSDKTISVGANTTSYMDSGLLTGSVYCYRVRAFNVVGESAPTNQACAIAHDGTPGGGTSPSLAVSPTTVSVGDTVNVTWSGISAPSATDWIGLYSPGVANIGYIDRIYVSCSKTAGNARASGSCSYVLPPRLAAGNYELRLFANDGFTRLATSSVLFVNSAITWNLAAGSTSPFWTRWADYHVTVKLQSMSSNSMGVMFRYRDDKNYYRFLWDRSSSFRRLEKVQNGATTVLVTDSVAYITSQIYQVEIIVEGPEIGVLVDGSPVFFVTDASFSNGTIGLYSSSNPGTIFDDVTVRNIATGATLLSDDFNSGTFTGWTMVDRSTKQASAHWSAATGALTQSSNVNDTFALYTLRDWADYRVRLTMQSPDRDSVGVMFRYQDNHNYYRFSWNSRNGSRRLEKFHNGVLTVLAEDLSGYVSGRTYQSEIIANGMNLQVAIDSASIFSVTDPSFSKGTIALYSNANQGSSFDDLLVEDLVSGTVLLWEDFNDGTFTGWTVVDDKDATQGPSAWVAQSGVLVQTSSIGSNNSPHLGTYALY